jgi:hypothetical protein
MLAALKADKGPDRHLKAWRLRVAHIGCANPYRGGHGAAVSFDPLEEAGGFEPADPPGRICHGQDGGDGLANRRQTALTITLVATAAK